MKSFITLLLLINVSAFSQTNNLSGVYENVDRGFYGPDGMDAFIYAEIGSNYNGSLKIIFGPGTYSDGYEVQVTDQSSSEISFFGGNYRDNCDNPGCCDIMDISGKIVNANSENPIIKVEYSINCPFPDDIDAPEGELVIKTKLKKTGNLL